MTANRHDTMLEICGRAPVVPVLVIKDLAHAAPLAKALVAGGLDVLEITLRTPIALDAIRAMREACPDAKVGVGTILTPEDVTASIDAGATFGVSPGATPTILDAVEEADFPFLPGTAGPSEAMAAAERGYKIVKLFPAEAVGGRALLKSLSSPLPGITFCPTGGITPATAPDYLALPNVMCVGGSWVAPSDMLAAGDWDGITALAKQAASLKS